MNQIPNLGVSICPSLLLTQCESIIELELKNLENLCRALEVIEQMKLYTQEYDNFELNLLSKLFYY